MALRDNFCEVDVLVVGAGPAGATAALNLAPTRRVALVDAQTQSGPGIAESLPPAARRLLADMGLWERFQLERHSPCYGNRTTWGSPHAVETDFLCDLDGHGWHINRARFDVWLRNMAAERGAFLLAPAELDSIAWDKDDDRWHARIQSTEGSVELIAGVAVDAGGRAAPIGRSQGAHRERGDRLVCSWVCGKAKPTGLGAGFTHVEAAEDGWWYAAPAPGGRRVLAFHTDSDLPGARLIADPKNLLERAAANSELAGILSESGFNIEHSGFRAAHSARLQPMAGPAWFAAGDAACSFDPLSSQGLLNALYSGLAAAEAADRQLSGNNDALPEYLLAMNQVYEVYRQRLRHWYAAETRWSDQPFWQRRQAGAS
jgi:flavin-dependent dehydrogenase